MLTTKQREALAKFLIGKTRALRAEDDEIVLSGLGSAAITMAEIIKKIYDDFGKEPPVIKVADQNPVAAGKYAVVVPTGNANSHNYILGEPVMMLDSDRALKINGSRGNNIGSQVRLATDGEIHKFASLLQETPEGFIIIGGEDE